MRAVEGLFEGAVLAGFFVMMAFWPGISSGAPLV